MSGRRSDLRGIWDSLFLESGYSIYNEDDEIQGFFLLLEGILVKMKGFAVDWSSMKNHNQKLLVELKESKDECEKFKNKLEKHKGPCEECSKLAKELQETKKSAKDAQKRMDSIAKILKLGDSIDPSQNEKNSALNLVTQMLRGSPAKNKCQFVETEMPDSPKSSGNIIIPDSYANHIQLKSPSPKKKIVSPKKVTPQKRHFSTSFPMVNSPKKVAKKNLTTDFDDEIIDSSPQKPLSFSIAPLLNDSLLDYVKTNNSQLEKIWFNEEEEEEEGEKSKPSPKKTEERTWSLKDRSGISKEKNQRGQRLKQLKLGIKHFKKETVDLSKFSQADDDCVIEQSPPEESRKKFKIKSTQSADTTLFKPLASSTQKPSTSRIFSDVDSSPDFIYKNDVVRKKAERKKLKGWECEECEKYYTALGNQISPSKVQERMNACSRHRSKFKPTGGTPPEFWNPYFPDSQDCKNRGLYESVYAPK